MVSQPADDRHKLTVGCCHEGRSSQSPASRTKGVATWL